MARRIEKSKTPKGPDDAIAAGRVIISRPTPDALISRKPGTLMPWDLTDSHNGTRIISKNNGNVKYCAGIGWIHWTGTHWQPDDSGRMMRLAIESARDWYDEAAKFADDKARQRVEKWASRSLQAGGLDAALKLAAVDERAVLASDELDADPWVLACRNGTVDLKTGNLKRAKQSDMITRCTNIDYAEDAPCPNWDAFLLSVFPDEHTRAYIHRAIGYTLTGDVREQCLFLLYGTGRNGKSTFLTAIQDALGTYALTTGFETFLNNDRSGGASPGIAALAGARMVSAVEADAGRRMAESVVKSITGGDPVTARRLYRDEFTFRPRLKLWLAANHRPQVRGTDDGIWRRMRMVPMLAQIPAEKVDRELPTKLQDELPGILAWAVRGCLTWQREGLGEPEQVASATAEYRADQDPLSAWIDERCHVGQGLSVSASVLYASYKEWSEAEGSDVVSSTLFGRLLTERGMGLERSRYGRKRTGIALRTESSWSAGETDHAIEQPWSRQF